MSTIGLELIRNCFEGAVPSILATADRKGVPNVSLISQVHYVDPWRVALSYQFFNKTRRNVLATGGASVVVIDPVTLARYRLTLAYEGTETAGPLFETMKARLAGIASHTGMEGVFRLLGSDVYRVRDVESVPGATLPPAPTTRNLLSAARTIVSALGSSADLSDLIDRTLDGVGRHLGIGHAMVLMLDAASGRLYTIASRGYAHSGVGSEVAVGAGVIGVAGREGVPIRIGHFSADYAYGAAIRDGARHAGIACSEEREIPFPGMEAPGSQIALPIRCGERMFGVLFAESAEPMRFWHDDEDALALIADHVGALMTAMEEVENVRRGSDRTPASPPTRTPIAVRLYEADNSVFLDHEYLIKGVAGAIFWKLVREHAAGGRTEFTNRELRLDPALRLPAHAENLEARLVLLQRRLEERRCPIRIERCGRGRFRLVATCPIVLEAGGNAASAV